MEAVTAAYRDLAARLYKEGLHTVDAMIERMIKVNPAFGEDRIFKEVVAGLTITQSRIVNGM